LGDLTKAFVVLVYGGQHIVQGTESAAQTCILFLHLRVQPLQLFAEFGLVLDNMVDTPVDHR
jgi:hypothetical protein